jgi:hypothetical protein
VLDLLAARKEWLEEIKHQIHGYANIPLDHILISCTHTQSGPTPVAIFQCNPDKDYLSWAGTRIADCARVAIQRLQPARIGWAVGHESRAVFNRRFHMKPGTRLPSPFLGIEDHVKTDPWELHPDIDRPAGPVDPEIGILAVQKAEAADGQPLAIFASFGMHSVGGIPATDVSADCFGLVAEHLCDLTGGQRRDLRQPFVAMLANGCFGDVNSIDVSRRLEQPYAYQQMETVARMVSWAIHEAWRGIKYRNWVPLSARQKLVDLAVRKPIAAELERARGIVEKAPPGPLRLLPEIYARETIQLAQWPERFKTPVQAFRIGELGMCALPGAPFCQIGLDIKRQSSLRPTIMVGMANDYAGYLPTQEQHALGGHETWRAKSSFLEVKAASAIQEAALELLANLAR